MRGVDAASRTGRLEGPARIIFLAAAALIGVATWLVIAGHPRPAGGAALGAGLLLLAGALRASATGDRLLRFLDSVFDRAFDGALLPAIALAMRHTDKAAAAAAVAATAATFVAAYMLTRGRALGYQLRELLPLRAVRYLLVAAGLLGDVLFGAMLAVLVNAAVTSVLATSAIARQEAT